MMSIECPNCEQEVKSHNNELSDLLPSSELYDNVYGTICPHCKCLIKPDKEPPIVEENRIKLKLLQLKVREAIRRKMFSVEKKNAD